MCKPLGEEEDLRGDLPIVKGRYYAGGGVKDILGQHPPDASTQSLAKTEGQVEEGRGSTWSQPCKRRMRVAGSSLVSASRPIRRARRRARSRDMSASGCGPRVSSGGAARRC